MTGPSRAALDAANSIIAEALSRQTGERWTPLTPDENTTTKELRMSKITSARRRALTGQLEREATSRGLALERRERTKGRWVWDVRDVERGTLAVRGVDLDQLGAYLAAVSAR